MTRTFIVAVLLALLALPASASAYDNFADSVAHPDGTRGKDWAEPFAAKLSSATKEVGEPDHAGYPGGHSHWISWRMYEAVEVQASVCEASESDLLIAVYTGDAVGGLTEVASESEETGSGCAVVEFSAKADTTYRIAIDAKSSPGTGYAVLWMKSYAPNDDFADATVVSEIPSTMHVDPQLATSEAGEPDHPGNGAGNSVWYRWTPAKSGFARIYNCDYWSGSRIAVYTGSSLGSLNLVTSGKGGGPCSEAIEPRFQAKQGTTYSIVVEGYAGKTWKMPTSFGWVPQRLLTVSKGGSGSGTVVSDPVGIECGGICEAGFYWGPNIYDAPAVTLTAIPGDGSAFVGWSGAGCSGAAPTCEMTLEGSETAVEAEFKALPLLLVTPPVSTSPPHASPKPKHPKRKCAKRKKKSKKGAKAKASKRRACKR
ncbi:MAG TPA: hypothetical protein VLI94_06650 [Solirubrobacterales bacterium]|nr:hypothetical protein [Solirubrobacterales bacterium]